MSDADDPSRWSGRRRARAVALQILYQCEVGRLSLSDAAHLQPLVGAPEEALELDEDSRVFAEALARGVLDGLVGLDAHLADAALNWRVERMAVVDRLVLRLGLHELLACPDTPRRVVIDEAIELARRYSGDDAARFVNGVLDGIYRKLKHEGVVAE
jgi:N utilization substance protein B